MQTRQQINWGKAVRKEVTNVTFAEINSVKLLSSCHLFLPGAADREQEIHRLNVRIHLQSDC